MTEERRRGEKEEKEEKDEKDRGGLEEKWRRDPLSAIFFGLIVVAFGLFLLFAALEYVPWEDWWAYLLMAIGAVLLIEAFVRYSMPAYRRPVFGRLLVGLVLICIGVVSVSGWAAWWPLVVVAIGVAILVFGIRIATGPKG